MSTLIWITGLAGSGKTTIGRAVYDTLKKQQPNTVFIDGDIFREITGNTAGHTREERFKVAMQIARLCKMLVSQQINVVCTTISLFKEVHEFNRKNNESYFEVFVDCSMDELMRRDKNKIYSRAAKGELKDVVGIDIPFDKPLQCDLIIDNSSETNLDEKVRLIIKLLN
jgi:cytidine diphosphoramidate kinase